MGDEEGREYCANLPREDRRHSCKDCRTVAKVELLDILNERIKQLAEVKSTIPWWEEEWSE